MKEDTRDYYRLRGRVGYVADVLAAFLDRDKWRKNNEPSRSRCRHVIILDAIEFFVDRVEIGIAVGENKRRRTV